MNKLGIHCQKVTDRLVRLVERWQPAVVVWVDPNPDGVAAIRAASPGTFVVGRKYEAGRSWRAAGILHRLARKLWLPSVWLPEPRGGHVRARISNWLHGRGQPYVWQASVSPESWADQCAIMAPCDAYVCWNEPLSHDDRRLFAQFDEWQVRFRSRMLEHGMEAVAFNFATGNFTKLDDVAECFPRSCAEFKYFGIHEYDWIIDPDRRPVDVDRLGFYWLRWPYWLADIGRDDATLFVTECGWTQAVHAGRPDEGWRSGADGVSDDDYIDWASWYNSQLVQDGRVGGAALYNFEGWGWGTFEHVDWRWLGEIMSISSPVPPEQPPPEPPPEPPGNGGDMDIEVYDLDYNERDFDYAEKKYGVAFRRAEVAPGRKAYRLVELWEKVGDTSLVTQVLDGDGQPVEGADMAFHWPDAPDPPDPPTQALPHDWHRNFVHGPTNANGEVGPGMGKGAYHGEGEGGPHAVWVRDPEVPSDICEGLGMLAGTFHHHLDQKFKLTVEGEGPPEPPPAEGLEEVAVVREDWPSATLAVAYPTEIAYDTRGHARSSAQDDLDTSDPSAYEHGGETYAYVEVCADFGGAEARTYWLKVWNIVTGQDVTPEVSEVFQPMPDRRRVVHVFDFAGEPPPPPPPPPDGDLEGRVAALEAQTADQERRFDLLCAAFRALGDALGGDVEG